MRIKSLVVWGVASLAANPALADDASETVQASVESINAADLGRPYNAAFAAVVGTEARSVFPHAKAPRKSVVNEWRSDFVEVEDLRSLRANARAWGIVEASLSAASTRRHLVYWVRVVEHVIELDDTAAPRSPDPGAGAVYYVRKIFYGRMYQIVISGSQEALNAKVAAEIQGLGPKFGVEVVDQKYKLSVRQIAKGLKPSGAAVFARTADEIKEHYKNQDMGPAVPIMVEYRRIAGVKAEPVQDIDWTPPVIALRADPVRTQTLQVLGNNSDWTSAGVTVGEHDLVVGTAAGRVTYSTGWNGTKTAEPDTKGTGSLEIRIGSNVVPAGKAWTLTGMSGEVKFRVVDTAHKDNSGTYDVTVHVIPEALVKAAGCQKQDPAGTFVTTDC